MSISTGYGELSTEYTYSLRNTHYSLLTKTLGAYIGGVHLFPFRTEQLSPPEPMVLP